VHLQDQLQQSQAFTARPSQADADVPLPADTALQLLRLLQSKKSEVLQQFQTEGM
jgi:hypothetical protein